MPDPPRTWTLKLLCEWCHLEQVWETGMAATAPERSEHVRQLAGRAASVQCPHCERWCRFWRGAWVWEEEPPLLDEEIIEELLFS